MDGLAISIEGLTKVFPGPEQGMIEVLDIEKFQVATGGATAIVGPNGSGKTTLLHIIAGILSPTRGRVIVDGTALGGLPPAERDRWRADHIGYIFQSFNLLSALSALENVMLPMLFSSAIPKAKQRGRARELLEHVGLGHRLSHLPAALSHGEQQRIAIARALANRPRIVLADEPSASLDPKTAQIVTDLLIDVCTGLNVTLLVATHDPGILRRIERVEEMETLNSVLR
jgi:putative ABC transport system ATP-binding protein